MRKPREDEPVSTQTAVVMHLACSSFCTLQESGDYNDSEIINSEAHVMKTLGRVCGTVVYNI